MRTVKNGKFLEFYLDNGKLVKYDLELDQSIGFSGKAVKGLSSQLRGVTVRDIVESCEDERYGAYIRAIASKWYSGYTPATVLKNLYKHRRFEQYYAAGCTALDHSNLMTQIQNVPKPLLQLCRGAGLKLSDPLIAAYQKNPDAVLTMLKYESMFPNADEILSMDVRVSLVLGAECINWHRQARGSNSMRLINDYGYRAVDLMKYIDRISTLEAMRPGAVLSNLFDYAYMMRTISAKYDRYPAHLLTSHQIAVRNYERCSIIINEARFAERYEPRYECTIDGFSFIYPRKSADVKDEAAQQHNCVASYIQRVVDGDCHIMFMRNKSTSDQSLVTLEVRDHRIVQAYQRFNHPLTLEQSRAVEKWNIKMKEVFEHDSEGNNPRADNGSSAAS